MCTGISGRRVQVEQAIQALCVSGSNCDYVSDRMASDNLGVQMPLTREFALNRHILRFRYEPPQPYRSMFRD